MFLRDTFKRLPIQYYALLDKFYVVESTFFLRNANLFEFGRLNKLFNRRIVHIEKYIIIIFSLKEFCTIDEVKKNQIVDTIPDVLSMEKNF